MVYGIYGKELFRWSTPCTLCLLPGPVHVDLAACECLGSYPGNYCCLLLWISPVDNLCECASGYRIVPSAINRNVSSSSGCRWISEATLCAIHTPVHIFAGDWIVPCALCSPVHCTVLCIHVQPCALYPVHCATLCIVHPVPCALCGNSVAGGEISGAASPSPHHHSLSLCFAGTTFVLVIHRRTERFHRRSRPRAVSAGG